MGIHEEPKYKDLKSRLDDLVREFGAYVNEYAQDGEPKESLFVSGFILGIMVTGMSEDGDDYDDVLYESNAGLNNFTAVGLANVQLKYYRDVAMGKFADEDDQEEM